MTTLISTTRLALFTAIPLEAVNYWFVGFPVSTHISSTHSWYVFVAFQWYLLHLPGVFLLTWSEPLRAHSFLGQTLLFLCGLIDTALLIAAGIFFFRLTRRLATKFSPRPATDNTEI
jgi:hypothetical protein